MTARAKIWNKDLLKTTATVGTKFLTNVTDENVLSKYNESINYVNSEVYFILQLRAEKV
jgi:hypothetical protein